MVGPVDTGAGLARRIAGVAATVGRPLGLQSVKRSARASPATGGVPCQLDYCDDLHSRLVFTGRRPAIVHGPDYLPFEVAADNLGHHLSRSWPYRRADRAQRVPLQSAQAVGPAVGAD